MAQRADHSRIVAGSRQNFGRTLPVGRQGISLMNAPEFYYPPAFFHPAPIPRLFISSCSFSSAFRRIVFRIPAERIAHLLLGLWPLILVCKFSAAIPADFNSAFRWIVFRIPAERIAHLLLRLWPLILVCKFWCVQKLLCLYAFPECRYVDGIAKRLPLCYEDCIATRQLFCVNDWALLESNKQRGFFIGSRGHFRLHKCEQLPKVGHVGRQNIHRNGDHLSTCSRANLTEYAPAEVTSELRMDVRMSAEFLTEFFVFDSDVCEGPRPLLPGQRVGDQRWPPVSTVGRSRASLAQPAAAQHFPGDARRREFLPQRRRRGAAPVVLHDGSAGPLAALQHPSMR